MSSGSLGKISFFIFLAITLISLLAGDVLYKNDLKTNTTRDIYNYTDNSLNWNTSNFEIIEYNESKHFSKDNFYNTRINNMIHYGINGMGGSLFEYSKIFIEIGYNSHGKYNMGYFLKLFNFTMWLIIIVVLFIPALFLGVGSYELIKYLKNKKKGNKK